MRAYIFNFTLMSIRSIVKNSGVYLVVYNHNRAMSRKSISKYFFLRHSQTNTIQRLAGLSQCPSKIVNSFARKHDLEPRDDRCAAK